MDQAISCFEGTLTRSDFGVEYTMVELHHRERSDTRTRTRGSREEAREEFEEILDTAVEQSRSIVQFVNMAPKT